MRKRNAYFCSKKLNGTNGRDGEESSDAAAEDGYERIGIGDLVVAHEALGLLVGGKVEYDLWKGHDQSGRQTAPQRAQALDAHNLGHGVKCARVAAAGYLAIEPLAVARASAHMIHEAVPIHEALALVLDMVLRL